MSEPKISVVIATYERPRVLKLALQSLLDQDHEDWEGLVIGDACAEETARVVAAFGDRRLRYDNLARNTGEQSGPNNRGLQLARAPYLAYLNHDDLWWPDHLSSSLSFLQKSGADLVFSLAEAVAPEGPPRLLGASLGGGYESHLFAPASTWLLKRELAVRLDGWRKSTECFDVPSQDFLQRAQRSGARLESHAKLTVLAIHSGTRPQSYVTDDPGEHELWAARLSEAGSRERELTALAASIAANWSALYWIEVRRPFLLAFKNFAGRISSWAGVSPQALDNIRRYGWRKGAFIKHLRKLRGLPPVR
jgi:glycosyltransferase involved in cell wall biosynthesis